MRKFCIIHHLMIKMTPTRKPKYVKNLYFIQQLLQFSRFLNGQVPLTFRHFILVFLALNSVRTYFFGIHCEYNQLVRLTNFPWFFFISIFNGIWHSFNRETFWRKNYWLDIPELYSTDTTVHIIVIVVLLDLLIIS